MNDTESFSRLYRNAVEHSRLVADGPVVWRVYELPAPSYDRRQGSSLVFEHSSIMRRLRDYPADWRGLDDGALLRLCNQRNGTRRRPRG
jgi:hypothetical protein